MPCSHTQCTELFQDPYARSLVCAGPALLYPLGPASSFPDTRASCASRPHQCLRKLRSDGTWARPTTSPRLSLTPGGWPQMSASEKVRSSDDFSDPRAPQSRRLYAQVAIGVARARHRVIHVRLRSERGALSTAPASQRPPARRAARGSGRTTRGGWAAPRAGPRSRRRTARAGRARSRGRPA